jgi:hypothetical protein
MTSNCAEHIYFPSSFFPSPFDHLLAHPDRSRVKDWEVGGLTFYRVRHIKLPEGYPDVDAKSIGQNCPKTRLLSDYQGKTAS